MNMSSVITQMAVLFLILAIGYIANKTKILNAESNKLLSRLILNITMPCLMLSSVTDGSVTATGSQALVFTLLIIASFALTFIIAWPVPNLLRAPREEHGIIRFMLIFANVGFMGYPVIQAIYGDGALFYVTLYNIPFNLLVFTIGIATISGKDLKLNLKSLLTPALVASVAAVLIFASNLILPEVLVDSVSIVGRMTTPGAMLIIGSTLAEIPVRDVFSEIWLYPVVLIKLIIIPVATWFVLQFFVADPQALGILIAEAGMPTAAVATMLSLQYGCNARFASKGVFLTTLFSVVTIPLLLYLLF